MKEERGKTSPYKRGQFYYDSLAVTRADCADAVAIRTAACHLRNKPEDAQPIFNFIGKEFPIKNLGPQAKDALVRIFASKHGKVMATAAFGGFNDENCYALAGILLSNNLPEEPRHTVAWFGQQLIEGLANPRYAN